MGELFRSEDMILCQLYLQAEAAYACISQLGELAIIQFKDLNEDQNAFVKKFVNEIRRCEEMERQLRYFEKEVKHQNVEVKDVIGNPEAPAARDMIDLEAQFEKHESELKELSNNIEALRRNFVELYELKFVLRYTEEFMMEPELSFMAEAAGVIGSYEQAQVDFELNPVQPGQDPERRMYLGYIAGVLPREKLNGFMRMLWFACRGNVFVKHVDIDEPLTDGISDDQVRKSVFMVFFQGEQLKSKIRKICEGYRATMYPCPDSVDERREMALGVLSRLQDLEHVLGKSQEQKQRVLQTIAENLNTWFVKVLKIKAIYHTMNKFHTEGQNYVAEGYLPLAELGLVQHVLNSTSQSIGVSAPSLIHPVDSEVLPTYHKTNKFTGAFQKIIDAYGVANYKEVNPAPFALITFPFLFSVMFGDAGHGLIMFVFALWMVLFERKLQAAMEANDVMSIIFGGRYVILMMGMFSIYSGLIYNDCFSKSLNLFGSGWSAKVYDDNYTRKHDTLMLDPNDTRVYDGSPYPFGLDPIWQLAGNKITFTNSYKEKISVILGVSQMLLGVILGLFNHVHFRKPLNVLCDFIPAILFLLAMFGYMDALIITKWIKYDASDASCAPNILIGYINMFLFTYPSGKDALCSNITWFPGQKPLQFFLVALAVICAVWMLLAKPLIMRSQFKKRAKSQMLLQNDQFLDINHTPGSTSTDGDDTMIDDHELPQSKPPPKEEEFEFGEVFIVQAIHTIEFCLGCVSHTASYLRLWALSLAHNQLSEVLWNMVLRMGTRLPGYFGMVGLFALFPAWAAGTLVILLLMEGLSAFLHTLRLHWVEFQSKFYKGDGFLFEPFSFHLIIKANRDAL